MESMTQHNLRDGFKGWGNCIALKVPEDKKVKIREFYQTNEADISGNTVEDKFLGADITGNKFLEGQEAKFMQLWFNGRRGKYLWN